MEGFIIKSPSTWKGLLSNHHAHGKVYYEVAMHMHGKENYPYCHAYGRVDYSNHHAHERVNYTNHHEKPKTIVSSIQFLRL